MRPNSRWSLAPQCLVLAVILAGAIAVSGCVSELPPGVDNLIVKIQNQSRARHREPVVSVVGRAIPAEITEAKLAEALRLGAVKAGWELTMVTGTAIEASYRVGDRLAVVRIIFGERKYSILYERSENLSYTAEGQQMIQQAYNGWVDNLDTVIQAELNSATPNASAN